MEKKIVDLSTLTDRELLQELADRLIAEQKSREAQFVSELDNGGDADAELTMAHDEDWCRVRECVRFIKGDDTIWEC